MDAARLRREGLSIAATAQELGAREHRLRRLINGAWAIATSPISSQPRIEAAKRRLADPAVSHTTVAAIAFDVGYGSVGPFNRAFRAATGQTPTDGVDRPCNPRPISQKSSDFKLGDDLSDPASNRTPEAAHRANEERLMRNVLIELAHIWWLNISILLPVRGLPAGVGSRCGFWLRGPFGRRRSARRPRASQLVEELSYSLRSMGLFVHGKRRDSVPRRAGFFPLAEPGGAVGAVWFWVSLALMILGRIAYIYWVHRWMHRPRWFRTFIVATIAVTTPRRSAAYSFDVGEAF